MVGCFLLRVQLLDIFPRTSHRRSASHSGPSVNRARKNKISDFIIFFMEIRSKQGLEYVPKGRDSQPLISAKSYKGTADQQLHPKQKHPIMISGDHDRTKVLLYGTVSGI